MPSNSRRQRTRSRAADPARCDEMRRSITPDELHEIYAAIGGAVWHLQFLEDVLVTYLTMRLKLKRPVAPEKAYAVLQEQRRKTLGMLLNDAKRGKLVRGEVSEAFQALLEDRNWLIHRSMHEGSDQVYTDAGREALLSRLRALTERSITLKKALYKDVEEWYAGQGLDVARAEAIAVKRVRRLRGA